MKLAGTETAEIVTRAVTEYTDAIGEQLIRQAAAQPSMTYIASQIGVPYRTLRYWLTEGRGGNPRYEYFAAEFDRARSAHEKTYISNLEEIAEQTENPKTLAAANSANQFLLKKLFPQQYGEGTYVATMIERNADGFDLSMLPTGVLREFMKTLKAVQAAKEGAGEQEVQRLVEKIKLGKTSD